MLLPSGFSSLQHGAPSLLLFPGSIFALCGLARNMRARWHSGTLSTAPAHLLKNFFGLIRVIDLAPKSMCTGSLGRLESLHFLVQQRVEGLEGFVMAAVLVAMGDKISLWRYKRT